jgi:nucleoside-diphosphate-sugar epimerase
MKVLLTGASGFIGHYVLLQLEKKGIFPVVVGRTCPIGFKGEFIEVDLLRSGDCRDFTQHVGASHLIHLAWFTEHGKYWNSPLNFRWGEASVRLVEAFCEAGGQKVVMAGTCAEYDWTSGYCREDSTELNPVSIYGVAKDSTRRLISSLCDSQKIAFAWGRIFFPYGKGEDTRRLVPSLIEVFRSNRPPFGVNANAFRDFLNVEDVASGFIKLLLSNAEGNYNISSGKPTQIADLVKVIAKVLNGNPQIILDLSTERPGEPEILFGDSGKLKALGWQPLHSIIDIAISQDH